MADSQRKTANLFNKDTDVVSWYIDTQGRVVSSSGGSYSIVVPCEANQSLICSFPTIPSAHLLRAMDFSAYPSVGDLGTNYSSQSGGGNSMTFTTSATAKYVMFFLYNSASGAHPDMTAEEFFSQTMLNTGSTALPYEPYWKHSLRKLTTATEAVENPLYSDGTAITSYTIKGNTVQSGTPTPSNPVDANGVGERTSNLLNVSTSNVIFYNDYPSSAYNHFSIANNVITLEANKAAFFAMPTRVEENTTYYIKAKSISGSSGGGINYRLRYYSDLPNNRSDNFISSAVSTSIVGTYTNSFTTPQGCKYILTELYHEPAQGEQTIGELMVSSSSGYEPYGYKIPISSGGVTTNHYTAEPLMKISDSVDSKSNTTETRAIRKYVITGQENVDYTLYSGKNMFTVYNAFDTTQDLSKTGVCSHYIFQWVNNYGYTYIANSCDKIYIYDENYDNASDYKAYLQQQYANGTPVTVWYILASPTTETVTAPSIPTTEGANSITVDTTVQPSEFTATWTGWHDAYVKEKSENLWNEDYTDISSTAIYIPLNVGEGNFTLSTTFQAVNDVTDIFLLSGNVTSGISSSDNGAYAGKNVTKASIDGYVTIAYRNYARPTTGSIQTCQTMLNSGSTAQTYEPYWK